MESFQSSKELEKEQTSSPSSSSPLPQANTDVPQVEFIEDEDEVEVVDRSELDKDRDAIDPVGANSGRIWGMVLSLFQHVPGVLERSSEEFDHGSNPSEYLDSTAQKLLSAKQVIDMYGRVTESSGLSSSIVYLMGRALHARVGGDGGPLVPVVKAAVGGGRDVYDNAIEHTTRQPQHHGSEHDLLQGEAWRSSASVVSIGDAVSTQANGINMGNAPANLATDAFVVGPSSNAGDQQQPQLQPQPQSVSRLVGPVHYKYRIDNGSAFFGAAGAKQEDLDISVEEVDRKVYEGDADLPITGFRVRPHPLSPPASSSTGLFDPSNTFDLGDYVETLYESSVGDEVDVCQGDDDSCKSGRVLRDAAGNGGHIVIGIDGIGSKEREAVIALDMSSHGRRALDQGVFVYPRGASRRQTESGMFTRQRALDERSSPLLTGTEAFPETAFMRLALACSPTLLDHVRTSRKHGRGTILTNIRQAADAAKMPLESNVESSPSSVTLEGLREIIRNDVKAYTAETFAQRAKRDDAQRKGILEQDRDDASRTLSLPEWDEQAYGIPPLVSAANVIGRSEAVSAALHASPDRGHLAFLKSISGSVFDEALERARRARSTATGRPSSSTSPKRKMRGGAYFPPSSSDRNQKRCDIDKEPIPLSHAILGPAETRVLDDKRAAEFEASNLVAFLFSEIDIGGDVGSLPVVEQVMLLSGQDGDACRKRLRAERRLALEKEREGVLEGMLDVETMQENRARLLQGIEQARHRASNMRQRGPPPSMWPQFVVPRPSVDVQTGFAREDTARALNDVLLRDFIELPFYRPELGALKISREQEIKQRLAGKTRGSSGSSGSGSGDDDPTGPEVLASEIGRFYDQKRRSSDMWDPVALPAMMAHMLQALLDAPDSSSVVVRAGNSEDALKDARTARNRAADAKKRMAAALFACKKEVGALAGDAPPPPGVNPTRAHTATVAVKRMAAIVDLQHPPSDARENIRQSFSTLSERKGELIEKHPDAARNFTAFRKNLETRIQFHAWARHHRQVLPACASVLIEALGLPFGNDPRGMVVKRSLREAVDEAARAMAASDRDASKGSIESAQNNLVQDERLAPGLASLRGLIGSGEEDDGSAPGYSSRGRTEGGRSTDLHTWHGFKPDHAQARTSSASAVGLVDAIIDDERRLKVSSYDRRPAKINACCITPLTEDYNHVRFYRIRVETALTELRRSSKAAGSKGTDRIAWLETVLTPDYGGPVRAPGDRPTKLVDGSGLEIKERKDLALEKQLSPVELIRFRLVDPSRNDSNSNDATSEAASNSSSRPAVRVAAIRDHHLLTNSDKKPKEDRKEKTAVTPASVAVANALFEFGGLSPSVEPNEAAAWKKVSDLLESVDFENVVETTDASMIPSNDSNISDEGRPVQNRMRSQQQDRVDSLDNRVIAAVDPVVKRSVEAWTDSVSPVGKYKGYADDFNKHSNAKRKTGKRKKSREGAEEVRDTSKQTEDGDVVDKAWKQVLDVSNKTSLADNLATKHVLLAFIRGTLRPALSCIAKSDDIRTDAHKHRFCEAGVGGDLARLDADLRRKMGDVSSLRSGATRALDGYTKGAAQLEAEMEAAAPRSASTEYVVNTVLIHAIVSALAEVAYASKQGRESDMEAASRLIRSLCKGLLERYEFAIKDQNELRTRVQEQIERENREMQALRQQIPEEQRQYLRELAKFKRINRKDLEDFVRKGFRPEAAAEAEGVDFLATTPPGVDDINKVREEDEVVGPDGMVEITKDMFGENRYSDLREPDQILQEQRFDGFDAGDEVDGGYDDDVDYEADGGTDDGEGGDYE